MRQFENIIYLSILNDNTNKEYQIYTDDFSIIQKSESSKNGILYSIEESIIIDKADSELRRRFSIDRKATIRLVDTTGDPIIIGSRQYPCLIHIAADLNDDILKVRIKSPNPII